MMDWNKLSKPTKESNERFAEEYVAERISEVEAMFTRFKNGVFTKDDVNDVLHAFERRQLNFICEMVETLIEFNLMPRFFTFIGYKVGSYEEVMESLKQLTSDQKDDIADFMTITKIFNTPNIMEFLIDLKS